MAALLPAPALLVVRPRTAGRRSTAPLRAAAGSSSLAESVQSAVDTASSLAEKATDAAAKASAAANVAADYLRPYIDAAAPVVSQAATETLRAATPVAKEGLKSALRVAQDSGVDVQSAIKSAAAVKEAAVPVAREAASAAVSLSQALAGEDPTSLALKAGAAVLLVLFTPLLLPALATALRGYASDLTPGKALDLLSSADGVLVDVRKAAEAEAKGGPVLPKGQGSKLLRVEFDSIADRQLRAAMADPLAVEAETTARIIAALKRTSSGKPVILLDANATTAKLVARKLAALGYRSVHVVENGFDGWVRAGLATSAPVPEMPTRGGFSLPGTMQMRK